MSESLTRTHSFRKHVRPMVDIDEEDDEQRRDPTGRKRVAVVHCLMESSSDETDEAHANRERASNILWLTCTEISHIRRVISQTTSSFDQMRGKNLCCRCHKKINVYSFLPAFLQVNKSEICYVCQRDICKKCSYYHFVLPSLKLLIPVRIQTLLKPAASSSEQKKEEADKLKKQATKIVCYDCLQIFNEHQQPTQYRPPSPTSPFRRTLSLPTTSSKNPGDTRHTRHRYRPRPVVARHAEETTAEITQF